MVFLLNYTVHQRHLQRTHTHPYEHMRTTLPLGALQRLDRQILKIDEVITDVPLLMGTSPSTESTNAVKS
jgi:hypothetical protein